MVWPSLSPIWAATLLAANAMTIVPVTSAVRKILCTIIILPPLDSCVLPPWPRKWSSHVVSLPG
jgi:hypothetical protein